MQRQTLRHLMPTAGAVLRNLLKPLEIQEPAFKEVVVLYRWDSFACLPYFGFWSEHAQLQLALARVSYVAPPATC